VAIWMRWVMFYNDLTSYKQNVIKSEKEELNPDDAEEGVHIDFTTIPRPKDRKISYHDCHQLDIEQLDQLDKMGYILPSEFKEKVMEYRETFALYNTQKRQEVFKDTSEKANVKIKPSENSEKIASGSSKNTNNNTNQKSLSKPVKKEDAGNDISKRPMPTEEKTEAVKTAQESKDQNYTARIPRMYANLYTLEKNK